MGEKFTEQDLQVVIDNYRQAGRDVSDIEKLRDEVFHTRSPATVDATQLQERIDQLREQATKSEGCCCICGESGKLLDGVCEPCFMQWATKVAGKARGRT